MFPKKRCKWQAYILTFMDDVSSAAIKQKHNSLSSAIGVLFTLSYHLDAKLILITNSLENTQELISNIPLRSSTNHQLDRFVYLLIRDDPKI